MLNYVKTAKLALKSFSKDCKCSNIQRNRLAGVTEAMISFSR